MCSAGETKPRFAATPAGAAGAVQLELDDLGDVGAGAQARRGEREGGAEGECDGCCDDETQH